MQVLNEHALKFAMLVGRVPPRALSATFVIKAGFRLQPGGVAELLPEELQPEFSGDQYVDDDPSRGLRYPSDFALFKPGADLLLAGHCHAPEGRTFTETEVVFGVGNGAKRLLVFGDRVWQRGPLGWAPSRPRPFTRMPLAWTHAFGGDGYPHNPVGRGIGERELDDGTRAYLLPNIESPNAPIASPDDRPAPAGFGPIDPALPLRASKTGTYTRAWLERNWPWLPDDFDWTFFNAAPPDQQWPRRYLAGDETLRFVHMHPRVPSYQCRLPGQRVRLFVKRREGQALVFKEVELRLDTLFADLDAEVVTLVWRGVSTAFSLKLKEFEEAFVVLEPVNAPLASDLAGYARLYAQRKAELAAADEAGFKPIEPFAIVPPREPDTAWADRLQQEADQLNAEAAGGTFAEDAAIDDEWRKAFGSAMPRDPIPPAPPMPSSLAEVDALINRELDKLTADEPGTAKPFNAHRPNFAALDKEFEEIEKSRASRPADVDEAPGGEGEDEDGWTRTRVEQHAAAGGSFDGQDLSGLDLSGLQFAGLSFREAVLDGARLDGCAFDGCDLTGASLLKASLADASFRESQLENADFSEAIAPSSIWQRARLTCAEFSNARLTGADFRECTGRHAGFDGCDLAQAVFDGCQLDQPDFTKAGLAGASFRNATLPDAGFYEIMAPAAVFEGAQIPRGRFTGAQVSGANFTRCVLNNGVLDDARLGNCNFTQAQLREAIFTGARAPQALFLLADCVTAKFDDAVATGARFVQTNLFRASFENADLTSAIFLGSNCYEVEFLQAVLTGTAFDQTNLKGTKLA